VTRGSAHIHGADRIWFRRFAGEPPERLFGDVDFSTMADLAARGADLEKVQRTSSSGSRMMISPGSSSTRACSFRAGR
jgi:hypothetical protein